MTFVPHIVCPTCGKPATRREWRELNMVTLACPHCLTEHDVSDLPTRLSEPNG